ncbi:DUF2306 domain-containing protein [Novosphingobium beihaiensis]|uniref:DUF2306 domain-containing protein n=1 Tax=Novosphingobium beihaiensis TaxID=2930389 RepID=A0ABT0BT46_9SPHN|nr:DUF2306 domain-containing protein [Novosphingobium beihaiensis]MCJ2188214.1 DUF2306 domain-containing protein [Novosphingobium beihaiensis]
MSPAATIAQSLSRFPNSRTLQVGGVILSAALALALLRHFSGQGGTAARLEGLLLIIHIATVLPAVPLGALVFALPKGDPRHRKLGTLWVSLMLVTAAVSFAIHGLNGQFHPIQPLAVLVVYGVIRAVRFARTGDIERHRRTMSRVYLGLVLAGAFTFLPSRLFGQWLLG